jgi:hypothetical protein
MLVEKLRDILWTMMDLGDIITGFTYSPMMN